MKLEKIFKYIEDNLGEKLSVEDVANYANYSSYHFQRMFTAAIGVSLGTYIRRRRLTKAALRMKESSDRLIEVALESGFESQESFTRSFKSMFGTTPNDYRKNQNYSSHRSMERLDIEFLEHIKNDGVNLRPSYITKEAFSVIGIKDTFSQNSTDIPSLWSKFISRIDEIKNIKNKESFGICEQIWLDGEIQDDFNYMAAVPVLDDCITPKGMERADIPKTNYAVFTHRGPLKTFDKTNRYVWCIWLPQSGKELSPTYDIEMYPVDFDPKAIETKIEIWIPIK